MRQRGERGEAVRGVRRVWGFQCSGRSERSKSPRARSGLLRAAQNRSEPLRVAQSGRSELFEEPLRVAQSAHRAAQRRSESLGACPEPLRAALNRRAAAPSLLVAACARSEPAQDRLHLCVRICSSKKLFGKAVSGLLHSALLNSVLLSSVNVYSRVRTSIYIYIYTVSYLVLVI